MVGFLVGITSLVDWLEEQLDSPPPRPPGEIDARIGSVSLSSVHEPYEDYLRATNQSLAGLPQTDRREQGLVFATDVRFKGSRGKRFLLDLALFDATTDLRLRDPTYNVTAAEFTPASQNHARTWPVWFPYPPRPGKFFVRATLLDAKEQPVKERDSRPFRITRIPPVPGVSD